MCTRQASLILVSWLVISNFRFLSTDEFFNKSKNTLGAGLSGQAG